MLKIENEKIINNHYNCINSGFAIPVYAINCYMEEHDANWCEVHQCDKSDFINDECHNHNEHHH